MKTINYLQPNPISKYKAKTYKNPFYQSINTKMKAQQRTLLESIEQNYNNQQYLPASTPNGLYVSETGTRQQLFLQKLINIYVLRKKEYNKIDQDRIQKLMKENSGGFTDLLLGLRFMAYCMENKIEVSYEKFGMLKLLTNWMDVLQRIKTEQRVNLCNSVFGAIHPENHTISSVEELIVYANYIAVDLQAILQRPAIAQSKGANQSTSEIQKPQITYNHLEVQDLLLFLNNLIPKTLFNVVIPEPLISGRPMTSVNPMDQRQKDLLYSSKSVEYFAKEKTHYQHLTKLLIWTLLKFDLSQSQQKNLMLIGIKYFYLFNRNKLQEPFSIWTKIFEKITEAVRFALSDELILFFKVIKKLGHSKFIQFLKEKYEFIEDLHKKMDPNGVIGYPKDALNVYHSLPIMQHIFVGPGTLTQRYVQILQPYSLLYFYIGVKTLDINIRFYYMGSFTNSVQKKQLLLTKQKCQIEFKGNIIAIEKGIYMFEFDNFYSWMKGKSLYYDTVVLTPLEVTKGGVERQKFLPVLFNKFQMNSVPQNSMIDISSLGIQPSSYQGQNNSQLSNQSQNQVFIHNETKKLFITTHFDSLNKIYNLKSVANGKIYEYESENSVLFQKKAQQIYETLQESTASTYEWYLDGKYELKGLDFLSRWCMDPIEFAIGMEKAEQPKETKQPIQSQQKQQKVEDMIIDQINIEEKEQKQQKMNEQEQQQQKNQQEEKITPQLKQEQKQKQNDKVPKPEPTSVEPQFVSEQTKNQKQAQESLPNVRKFSQQQQANQLNEDQPQQQQQKQYPTLAQNDSLQVQIPTQPQTQTKTENTELLEEIQIDQQPTKQQTNQLIRQQSNQRTQQQAKQSAKQQSKQPAQSQSKAQNKQ